MSHNNTSLKAMRNRTSYKTVGQRSSGQDRGPVMSRVRARFHCFIPFLKRASCSWWAAAMLTPVSYSRLSLPQDWRGRAQRSRMPDGDQAAGGSSARCGWLANADARCFRLAFAGMSTGASGGFAPSGRAMWPSWGTCSPVGREALRRAAALLAATAPVNSVACSVAMASGRPSR
jgi:hypothetical protein